MEVLFYARKCWLWFPIRFTKYEVVKNHDDYELIIHTGLIAKREERIKLFKVNDLSYHRGLGNWICGVGNITLRTSDVSTRTFTIEKIRRYRDFGFKLEELIDAERKRVKITYTETNII